MSDDDQPLSPDAEFLQRHRESVAEGNNVYPLGSPRQIEKLAELDAQIEFRRRIGEMPPAPEPMSADLIAKQRLASEWPGGEPSAALPDYAVEQTRQRLETLTGLDDRRLAAMTDELAKDLADNQSSGSFTYSGYRPATADYPSGHEVLAAMVADAKAVIDATYADPAERTRAMKLVQTNRSALEAFAARGRAVAAYAADRKKYGI